MLKLRLMKNLGLVAKELFENVIKVSGEKGKIVEEFKGKSLEGEEYEHFLDDRLGKNYSELKKKFPKVHSIILNGKFVDTSTGTGLVHAAPGCGPEDQEACESYGIMPFNTLNSQGIFENMESLNGMVAKEDDYKFIKIFEELGVLIAKEKIEHEYPPFLEKP